jgi:hypothetical protein
MISRILFEEPMPPGGVRPRWVSALAGRGGPLELLIGMHIPGSTALAGRQELLSGEHVLGSNRLAV